MEEAPTKRALQDECQNCKSVKIPCSQKGAQLTTDEAAASCKRCARLGLPCRFAPKKTGRPRQYPARTKTTKTIKPTPTSSTTTAQVDNPSAHDHVGKKRSSDETENEGSTSKRPVPASHNQSIGLDPDIFGSTGELGTIPEPFRDWQGSLQAPFTSFDGEMAGLPDMFSASTIPDLALKALAGPSQKTDTVHQDDRRPLPFNAAGFARPLQAPSSRLENPVEKPVTDLESLLEPEIATDTSSGPSSLLGDNKAQGSPDSDGSSSPDRDTAPVTLRHRPRTTGAMQDPIDLGLLSYMQAECLFEQYYERLNPMILLLDPMFHHLDQVRERSKPLLTAILGVTARFRSPDIASRCFDHLDIILSRAVFAGESDIHLVQALLLAIYWRTPGDKSSWAKTGIAVRMAQALGLHHCFSQKFTDKFSDPRDLLNLQRTWLCVVCFDRSFSHVFRLPRAIQSDYHAESLRWLEYEPSYHIPSDCQLASNLNLVPITDFLYAATEEDQSDASAVQLLQEADDFLVSQEKFWFSAQNLPPTSRYIAAIMFSLAHSVVRWYALRKSGDSPSARTQFLAAASNVADNISAAADAELLHLWFDAGVTNVSDIGLCLFKLFDVERKDCRTILSSLHRLQYAFRHPNLDTELSFTSVSRFFGRLVDRAESLLAKKRHGVSPIAASHFQSGHSDYNMPGITHFESIFQLRDWDTADFEQYLVESTPSGGSNDASGSVP